MSVLQELDGLLKDLGRGKIVPLPAEAWADFAEYFDVVDRISTGLAGEILLVRRPTKKGKRAVDWALVEAPRPDERVVRPLANETEARALIADRLAAYERMWDG